MAEARLQESEVASLAVPALRLLASVPGLRTLLGQVFCGAERTDLLPGAPGRARTPGTKSTAAAW